VLKKSSTIWVVLLLVILLTRNKFVSISLMATVNAQTSDTAEDEEEERAEKVNDRYLQLLKRSPRMGTSLDRIYGFHVDRGTLDSYLKTLSDEVAAGDPDGSSSMILGMMEMRRGRDSAARFALELAEQHRTADPIASWYLGNAFIATGETDKAIAALERAISRSPTKADQLEIYQSLGRILQRSQKSEQALELWKRFEAAFPNDERVQEQIASTLVEDGQMAEAMERFKGLSKMATDPYRKVQFAIQAADLKLKLGQQKEALSDFENQLQQLKPSSWLFNDVRSRIEASFLRTDDYAGLVAYYEGWMKTHPDDLDAMSRIGKYLAIQGRADAAREWYEKAITRAPSDKKLRLSLIEQLIADGKYADAIAQYEQLVKINPGNPDHIERWGMLYLRHESLTETERKAKATEIWTSLLIQKPDDAVVASRVADLFRSASMVDEALQLYVKCVELAPENPQYREYLGEYYHILQRPEDAKKTWQQMVAGDLRTTQNLVRLSEVFKGFGYQDEAVSTMQEACAMDPDFGDLIRFSTMLRDAKRFDDSLAQLDRADKLTASREEAQIVLNERIKSYLEGGQLTGKAEELTKAIGSTGTFEQWRILAQYQEALCLMPDAARSAKQAVDLSDGSVAAWVVAARVMEKAGLLGEASAANAKLMTLDRRYKTEYLKTIADLERRLGRLDDALQAGKDLITAAPGNPKNYQFYADLCFQLGKPELGLDALRKSVRVNPSDVGSLTSLAKALAEQFKTPEAIELYWRAFAKAEGLDDQVKVVQTLAELYLRTDTFDRLITRLENIGKELNQRRDMTICLANCYQAVGDIGMAREVLKSLLNEETRDVLLLDELSKLSEQAEEFEDAVDYQKQLVELAKSPDAEARLANLLIRSGDLEAAELLWSKLLNSNAEPHRLVKSIDGLIEADKLDAARKLCDQLLSQSGEDWEALLRLSVIDWKQDKKAAAADHCDRILALRLDQEAPSHGEQFSRSQRSTVGSGSRNQPSRFPAGYPKLFTRTQVVSQIMTALGMTTNRSSSSFGAGGAPWSVSDFAEARNAAITIKMGYATEKQKADDLLSDLQATAELTIATNPLPAWDYFVANLFQQQTGGGNSAYTLPLAELLVKRPEPEAKLLYLISLQQRSVSRMVPVADVQDSVEPLSAEQLAEMMDAWSIVNASHPEWSAYGGGIQMVIMELERANKVEKANELFENLIRPEASVSELAAAMQLDTSRGNLEEMLTLTHRIVTLEQAQATKAGSRTTLGQLGMNFSQVASQLVSEKEDWDSVRQLITSFLDIKADSYSTLSAASTTNASITGFSTTSHYQVFAAGKQSNYQQIETLSPNHYINSDDVTFIVNLHALYKDRIRELLSTLLDYRESSTGTRAVFAELMLAHVQFLIGSTEQAAIHLVRAAELQPEDVSLRINLVQFYQTAGNDKDALDLLETIEAADQSVMKEREQLALSLATKTGNIDRAKLAAERLFGLRLDNNFALNLSTQMQQLGMTEMSEALLARTRKSAGNDVSTLMALMTQYKSQDNTGVVAQIAHQILRKISASSAGATNSRNATALTSARSAAVEVLGKSGQLDSMIDRVRDQLTRSPKSIPLYQTLEEYYQAAGKTKEAEETAAQLAELQPANIDTLLRMAQQLERSRKYSEACDKYLLVLEKDIQRYGQNYYQYLRTFQSAKRLGDLADVMMKSDLSKLQNNYHVVTETVQYLFRESGRGNNAGSAERKKGLELFAAAWKAFPQQRTYLLSNIHEESLWASPEMLSYAKEGMVPGSVQQAVAQPWLGIADSMSYNRDGDVTGTLTRVCNGLKDPKDLKEFTDVIADGVQKYSGWHGGQAILCALKAKSDDVAGSLQILDELKENKAVPYIPPNVAWVLGSILEPIDPKFQPYCIELLEAGLEEEGNRSNGSNGFSCSPWRRLGILYSKAGNNSQARTLVHKGLKASDVSSIARNNPGYQQHMDLQNYQVAAGQLLEFGFPFDAIELYKKITPELVAASGRYGGNSNRAVAEARSAESEAIKTITPEAVLNYLKNTNLPEYSGGTKSVEPSTPTSQPLDLMLTVSADGVEGGIESIVLDGLLATDLKEGKNRDSVTKTLLDMLQQNNTSVLPVAIAAVALGDKLNDEALQSAGFSKLADQLKANASTEPQPAEIGLWIAGRLALKSDESHELGLQLATRAQSAAEASDDDRWMIAMMKERGNMAIALGDKPAAEKAWSRLLDAVLADSSESKPDPKSSGTARPATAPAGTALQELRERLLNQPSTNKP